MNRTRERVEWTRRQREVLELLARGYTNGQIGEQLGISLDGAKWHVSEVMSKLGVAKREQAAAYWRDYQRFDRRLLRAARGFAAPIAWRWAAAATVGVAALTAGGALFVLLRGGDDDDVPAATDATSTPAATVSATPVPSATPSPAPSQATTNLASIASAVTGLDVTPRDGPVAVTRTLAARPQSPFPEWDQQSAVIYDRRTGAMIDLGPAVQPVVFSPGERYAVWVSGSDMFRGGEAWVLDLATGERRNLGEARLVWLTGFQDEQHVLVYLPGGNDMVRIDLVTGEREPYTGDRPPDWQPAIVGGYVVEVESLPTAASELYRGGAHHSVVRLRDPASNNVALEFEAFGAVPAGDDALAVAAVPVGDADGVYRSNIYIVPLATGVAEYVATAVISLPNWPFAANDERIVWTDAYCGEVQGRMHIFERRTGALTTIADPFDERDADGRYIGLSADGQIALGAFGADSIVDPATLQYTFVLPWQGDIRWSPSWRYATIGPTGGHGGIC
jgi:DNA-binding CsgD family transcriptional regulator